jgi:hypothetical protein
MTTPEVKAPPLTHSVREARARLRLLVDLAAPEWVQVGCLAVLYGGDSDQPEGEDADLIVCFRCGVTSTRAQWRASEDRSCPFCHRSRLP